MTKETISRISSAVFTDDPQRYLSEASVPGRLVEVTAPSGDTVVILSKRDFDGYVATSEILSNPQQAEAIKRGLAEFGDGAIDDAVAKHDDALRRLANR